jgi:sugar lactone lactonase YvrE/enterochelin esterase-like enzyme
MPAGGLFSTAHDLSLLYRMLANRGTFNGTRILSENAVQTMTSDQTGAVNSHYGFGLGTDGKSFTHGGAYGTNSRYDIERKLVTVFLVQHAGWAGNGKTILPEFQKAAAEAYAAKPGAKPADNSLVVGINSAPDMKEKASDDWGLYSIRPVGGATMVLEPVDGVVTIGKPTGSAQQKWAIVRNDDGFVSIKPSHDSTRALSVEGASTQRGTRIVLEPNTNKASQLWALHKQEGGAYTLSPKHAPDMGLDDLGGKTAPGSKIDLWDKKPGDSHLHWLIQPLAGSLVAEPPAVAQAGAYVPPAIKPEDILPGEIKQFSFAKSKVFPGTIRDVTVFIPAQYDAKKPACVYVKTDGFNPREKLMMETMIATKEMPVTIGVFVRPGDLPSPIKGTLGRRNRDLEYDGIGTENVRFLVDELLPFVAKEYQLNLSTDGNDRCMSGGSSGGIAAFTAAWHRPDAFSRVYAASGSWVAFRGGHEFPTMVRKFEAKPIRAFLTTATHDMENCAGDWFLADQEMDKSLKFSGYDYKFRTIEGRHVAGYGENYQEAMAYLWKDWPQRVKAGPSAPRAQEVLLPDEGWHLVAEGFKSTRGPSCNAEGEVFFADTSANKIHRINKDGTVSEFATDTGYAHCVSVGADGALYTISERSGKLMRYSPDGAAKPVMDDIFGHSILAMPNGGLYVTTNTDKPRETGTVWFVKDGQKRQVDSGLTFATGMAYRPDQWLLSVADGHSKWAYSYQISDDGTLVHKERFFQMHVNDWQDDAGAESVCYSREGRQFLATKSGVQISADDGPTQIILPVPGNERVTGVAIGGSEMDTLFALCGNKIWRRKIRQHATGAWSPWTKVEATKL